MSVHFVAHLQTRDKVLCSLLVISFVLVQISQYRQKASRF